MAFKHSAKHPGFKLVSLTIAHGKHIPLMNAQRILGAAKAHASAAARRRNPRLNRTGGTHHHTVIHHVFHTIREKRR